MRFVLFLLVALNVVALSSSALSPVILVPGDGGSQIDAIWEKTSGPSYLCTRKQGTWYNIWLNLEELVPYTINCWAANVRLEYDNLTRTTKSPDGIKTRIPGFGLTDTVEYLDPSHLWGTTYFYYIVEAILPLGYKRNFNILGAPFDFRKAPNELGEFLEKFKKLIEDTYEQHQEKVTLIAHSMGGPISHYFLAQQSQEWKDKHIQALIGLSAPWAGAVKSVKVFAAGYNLGHYVLPTTTLRTIQRSNPSLAFLLPSPDAWDETEILAQTPNKNYSLSNIKEYFDDLNFPDGYMMYEDTRKLLLNAPPPGVEVHCLHGSNVPTTDRIFFNKMSDFPDSPTAITGDGDGTVNARSCAFCLKWARHQKERIYHYPIKGVNHMQMLTDKHVTDYIVKYLKTTLISNDEENEIRSSPKERKEMEKQSQKLEEKKLYGSRYRTRDQIVLAEKWKEHSSISENSMSRWDL